MNHQKRTHVLSVRLTPEQWTRLEAVAKAEGDKTPSRYVRRILSLGTRTIFDNALGNAAKPAPLTPAAAARLTTDAMQHRRSITAGKLKDLRRRRVTRTRSKRRYR